MDDQQLQAYVQLIEQLLSCPQGQEAEILQSQTNHIDGNLLMVMEQYSAYLESQGNSNSLWLRELAGQLSQSMGINKNQSTGTATTDVMSDAMQFMHETLILVAKSKRKPQQIYQVWSQQRAHLNSYALEVLPEIAIQLLAGDQDQKIFVASILIDFGNLIQGFPLGEHWLNSEFSIVAYKLALQVYTRETFPHDWAVVHNNLASAYQNRLQGDRTSNIEQAVHYGHLSLQVFTYDKFPEQWSGVYDNLANAYSKRLKGDRADNLEQAIDLYKLALQVRTREAFPKDWAMTHNNLAATYRQRIRGEKADNLEQAIDSYKLALQVRTREAFPKDWSTTQNNLAVAYTHRIRGDQAQNIEQAIHSYQLALLIRTRKAFPKSWAMTQHNLACAYSKRIQGDRAENIEQAIHIYHLALQVRTREKFPQDYAETQNNLAGTYIFRIKGDRAENIEQAIHIYHLALQVSTRKEFSYNWATTQHNLAIAYSERIKGNRAENVEESILAYRLALQVRTRDTFPDEWAMTHNNLANSYKNRIWGDRVENIEQAIECFQSALQVYTQPAHPRDWATIHNNLAIAYNNRKKGERSENIEKGIISCQLALKVRTREELPIDWAATQNNLANLYRDRVRGTHIENFKLAVESFQLALQVSTCETSPSDCRGIALSLGNLYSKNYQYSEAIKFYSIAIEAAELLYQNANLLYGKSAELAQNANLFCYAAYAYAHNKHLFLAIQVLERSRARVLSESLDRDRANLDTLKAQNPTLHTQYKEITQQLRNLEAQQRNRMVSADRNSITPEIFRNEATRLRQDLTTTLGQIRQHSGYENFLTLPTYEDVQKATHPDRPLIYLLTTPAGSLALIATPDNIHPVWLNEFTETHLIDLLKTWFDAYNEYQRDPESKEACQAWHDIIDQTTRQFWQPLIAPIVTQLKTLGITQAVLIPTSYLSFFPLHAAWTEDPNQPTGRRYALDDIHFTYTPNAKSLTTAKEIADRVTPTSILAINNPTQDLDNTELEVQAATAHFLNPTILKHGEATVEQVKMQLSNATITHFSCHGSANLNDPLTSGLVMSNQELLTLRDIFALNLADTEKGNNGLRLAILSACETGMIGIENADEAISLPTGLLQAGVAAVIASLWAVQDDSTMLLLTKFYDLWRKDGLEPSQALRQAQIWLRDSTEREVAPLLGQRTRNPDKRPFSHPYYWSAFSYTGI